MGNSVELLSLKCASCGAALQGFQGKSEVKCDFCSNTTQVLRPIKVEASVAKLSAGESERFNNLVSIMEKSMIAGNYREAYEYCNKALEIDSDSAALWENKAICSFWLRSDESIIQSQAKEIVTYLNSSKLADPNSPTYENTAKAIAFNLFFAVYYRYAKLKRIMVKTDKPHIIQVIDYLESMDLCFDIYSSVLFLDTAVKEITFNNKCIWTIGQGEKRKTADNISSLKYDPLKSREKYIRKLKSVDPAYVPPEFRELSTKEQIIISMVIIIVFIILMAIIY